MVPKDTEANWAAVENVIKKDASGGMSFVKPSEAGTDETELEEL